jgi:hypothetical protein
MNIKEEKYVKIGCIRVLECSTNFYAINSFTGIPTLAYGTAARFMIQFEEVVHTPHGPITIYFLMKEDYGSKY